MSATVKIVHPKRGPNEIPWSPDYEYVCTGGHDLGAERPLGRCPVFVHVDGCRCSGRPDRRCGWCAGELIRIGKGSRCGTEHSGRDAR